MALPYPMSPVSPFDVITSQAENEKIANIESLADGTGIDDGAVTAPKINLETLGFATYSSAEKDTGFKWTDGKAIFRRVFSGIVTAGASINATSILGSATGLSEIISSGGHYDIGVNGIKNVIPSSDPNTRYASVSWNASDIRLISVSGSARTNAPFTVWVEYTKS